MTKSAILDQMIKQAVNLIKTARNQAVRQTNSLMVLTYFHLGKLIVEQEQKGKPKAQYGKETILQLSEHLTKEFGNGFSVSNLEYMRTFYTLYKSKYDQLVISQTASGELYSSASPPVQEKSQTLSAKSSPALTSAVKTSFPELFLLSWSHYVTLLRVKDEQERSFYEIESAQNHWSVRELKRQMDSGLFERLALSKDKKKIKELAAKGQIVEKPEDLFKSPYILEFLALEEKAVYTESDLETAIINKIEHFLLEMGRGSYLVAAR